MAHPTLGLAPAAHPELDDPAAGHAYQGDDPDGYLSAAAGRPTSLGTTRRARRCYRGHRHRRAAVRPGVRGGDRPGPLAGAERRLGGRGDPQCRSARPCLSRRDRLGDRRGLPQPRPAAGRRRAGRRVRRRAVCRSPRSCPLRQAGHACRRRARPGAAPVPGPRHPLVDGRVGLLDERWDEMQDLVRVAEPAVAAARRAPRTLDLNALGEPACALVGRFAGVRDGVAAVLRLAGERLRSGRPQARAAARHDRRPTGRARGGGAERFEPTAVPAPALPRGSTAGHRERRVGDRRPAGLLVAGRARVRPPRPAPARRRRHPWPGLYVLGLPLLRRRRST